MNNYLDEYKPMPKTNPYNNKKMTSSDNEYDKGSKGFGVASKNY